MPIKPELRKFYGPEWRNVTRRRILERAGNKCEKCGVPNRQLIQRACGWWLDGKPCLACSAPVIYKSEPFCRCEGFWRCSLPNTAVQAAHFPKVIRRWVGIVLAVAHLNHVSGDDRDENLKALCQWCHLHLDQDQHKDSRCIRKDAARPLLQEAS